jgi:hypothetical protein
MYCGASNRNDRVVLSRKILINITCESVFFAWYCTRDF